MTRKPDNNRVFVYFFGIGTDMEDVERFRKLPFEKNPDFYKRIFTPLEIQYCLEKGDPYPHFAARFCAKEAVIKVLSDVSQQVCNLNYKEIQIDVSKAGCPCVTFKKNARLAVESKNLKISLSHTSEHAIATALYIKDRGS